MEAARTAFDETITLRQAKKLIQCMAHEQSFLLLSAPGMGKSEMVYEAAREAGLPCRSLLGTQIAPDVADRLAKDQVDPGGVNGCQNPCKDGGTKKAGMPFACNQPLLAIDRSVANEAGQNGLSRPSAAEGGGRRPAFTGRFAPPYSATEIDG